MIGMTIYMFLLCLIVAFFLNSFLNWFTDVYMCQDEENDDERIQELKSDRDAGNQT